MDEMVSELISDSFYQYYRDQLSNIKAHETIFVLPHLNADGDALGACFAMVYALVQQGYSAFVLAEEPLPEKFLYLNDWSNKNPERYIVYDSIHVTPEQSMLFKQAKLWITLDCHGLDRLGSRSEQFEAAKCRLIIDHHLSDRAVTPFYMRCIEAAATCQLVAELFIRDVRGGYLTFDDAIANCLMTGLLTDTGRFSFTNTTGRVMETAAFLIDHGAEMRTLTHRLFDEMNPARLKLIGRLSDRVQYHAQGRLAISYITHLDIEQVGAIQSDLDGLVNLIKDVKGVDVAVLFRTTETGDVRGNIRSNACFNSSLYARTLGGGGHAAASGFTVSSADLYDVMHRCQYEITQRLEQGEIHD